VQQDYRRPGAADAGIEGRAVGGNATDVKARGKRLNLGRGWLDAERGDRSQRQRCGGEAITHARLPRRATSSRQTSQSSPVTLQPVVRKSG
jgi:hypothetical protein